MKCQFPFAYNIATPPTIVLLLQDFLLQDLLHPTFVTGFGRPGVPFLPSGNQGYGADHCRSFRSPQTAQGPAVHGGPLAALPQQLPQRDHQQRQRATATAFLAGHGRGGGGT